jgi:hypothetical protein
MGRTLSHPFYEPNRFLNIVTFILVSDNRPAASGKNSRLARTFITLFIFVSNSVPGELLLVLPAYRCS